MNFWITLPQSIRPRPNGCGRADCSSSCPTSSPCSNICFCSSCPRHLQTCRWWTSAGRASTSPCSARPSSGTSSAMTRPTAACPTSAPTWWPWSSASASISPSSAASSSAARATLPSRSAGMRWPSASSPASPLWECCFSFDRLLVDVIQCISFCARISIS